MNSYDPCKQHINGHTPQCLICEIEALRELLREVANCPVIRMGVHEDFYAVKIPGQLWIQLLPLRNTATNKEG